MTTICMCFLFNLKNVESIWMCFKEDYEAAKVLHKLMGVHPGTTGCSLRPNLHSSGKKKYFPYFLKASSLKTKRSHTYHPSAPLLLLVKHMESSGVQNSHFLLSLLETQVLV